MCTANNKTASAANATNTTSKSATNWRTIGTGFAIGAGAMSAMSAYSAGTASQAYYNNQAATLEANARLGEQAAQRQIKYDLQTAAQQVKNIRRAGRKNYGKQLVAAVASGQDLSSVSFQDVVLDSARAEQEDIDLIKRQAAHRADEMMLQAKLNTIDAQNQATQARIAGKLAKKSGRLNAYSSMLSTAASVAGMWGTK